MNRRPIIAIDPGVVTGVAIWDPATDETVVKQHEIDSLRDVAFAVKRLGHGFTIVTEKFTISARTLKGKVMYDSLYFNGWLSIEYPHRIEQTPAAAKSFVTDEMLKFFGWFHSSKDGHANDATRHLILAARKEPYIRSMLTEFVLREEA